MTSNLSFSHSDFKWVVMQTQKKPGLAWERVKGIHFSLAKGGINTKMTTELRGSND